MAIKTLKFENLKTHIIVWIIFIAYEILVVYTLSGRTAKVADYAGHYAINIALFYFNAHLLLPNTVRYNKASYITVPLAILLELIIYFFVVVAVDHIYKALHINMMPKIPNLRFYIIGTSWRGVWFIGLSTAYWLALSTIQNRKQITDLETAKLKGELQQKELEKSLLATENAFLKSQINPHFLLNTLNFIYNSVSKFSDKIADSIMMLSEMMRYALTNADKDGKVSLEAELDQIVNFVKLNQLRFDQRLNIEVSIEGETEKLKIIPLVLVTLAENVFKYGDLSNENQPALIKAIVTGNELKFTTYNTKKKIVNERGYGIGISNIKSRLQVYKDYEFSIENTETEFTATLIVEL